jgi:hypothetical protein
MIPKDRRQIDQLVKAWAQQHTAAFTISDPSSSEEAMNLTAGRLTWLIQEGLAGLDLLSLADRIEIFLENRKKNPFYDGMFCRECGTYYQFAEPNHEDGSLECYSCRHR